MFVVYSSYLLVASKVAINLTFSNKLPLSGQTKVLSYIVSLLIFSIHCAKVDHPGTGNG